MTTTRPDHLSVTLCLDHAGGFVVSDVHGFLGQSYVFVNGACGLSLWARDPKALRRLAKALETAAGALDAVAVTAQAPA